MRQLKRSARLTALLCALLTVLTLIPVSQAWAGAAGSDRPASIVGMPAESPETLAGRQGEPVALPSGLTGVSVTTPRGNSLAVSADNTVVPPVPGSYKITGRAGDAEIVYRLEVTGVSTDEDTEWTAPETDSWTALDPDDVHIAVSSDTHIGRSNGSYGGAAKTMTGMEAYNKLAPDIDAYVFAGDCADMGQTEQYKVLSSALAKTANPDAALVLAMGNHDYYDLRERNSNTDNDRKNKEDNHYEGQSEEVYNADDDPRLDAQDRFLTMTDMSSIDQNTVVAEDKSSGGYHIITFAPRPRNGTDNEDYYDFNNYEPVEDWILQQVRSAAAEDPNKPILLASHQGFLGTVEYTGNSSWTGCFSQEFYDSLKQYPQVIHFSGHSHIPLNDPRSIYQDGFTMVQTATLGNDFWMESGFIGSDGKTNGHPADGWDASQGMMVSIDPDTNIVTILRMDMRTGNYIGTPWTLNIPEMVKNNQDAYLYTPEKRMENSVLPTIPDGVEMTLTDITQNSVTIHVPDSKIVVTGEKDPDDIVEYYRVAVYAPGEKLVKNDTYLSEYYLANKNDIFTRIIGGLEPGTDYTVMVYPINAYEKEGGRFAESFTTKTAAPVDPEAPPAADFLQVDFSSGSADDFSGNEFSLTSKGAPVIVRDETLQRTAAKLDGSSAYGYDMAQEDYDQIKDSFTSEVLFRLDQTPTGNDYVEIYSSGQTTGQNFEYYGDGRLYYYVSLSGSWVSVGAPVPGGQWTHAAATYDGSSLKLYLNGRLAAETALSGSMNAPAADPRRYYIGADVNSAGEPEFAMTGSIALGRTYTSALTPGQIMGLYLQEQTAVFTAEDSLSAKTGRLYTVPTASAVGADGSSLTVSTAVADPSGNPVTLTDGAFTPASAGKYTVTYKAGKNTITRALTVSSSSSGGGSGGSSGGSSSSRPSASVNGSGGTISSGSDGTVTITPSAGYQIASITVNGKSAAIPGDGKLTGLKSSDKVVVTFEKKAAAEPHTPQFSDVQTHWAKAAIAYIVDRDLFSGTSETTFSPDMPMSRAMLVTVLHKLAGTPAADSTGTFTDVSAEQFYSQAVYWAANSGITSGTAADHFSPDQDISREQLAAILFKYAKQSGADLTPARELSGFSDQALVSDWAADAMKWAVGSGFISGKTASVLDPSGPATRAEAAAVLQKFLLAQE